MAADDVETPDRQSDDDYLKPTPDLDSDELLIRFKEWWKQDFPACNQWHTRAASDFKFRAGDQWDEADKTLMSDLQRACLEFNQVDPIIDSVAGQEITNRQEVRYIPRQQGSAEKNEVLTEGARWFRDDCEAEFEESAAFTDAATCGMGWVETRLDYEINQDGDPKIERCDVLEMVWDNAAKQSNVLDARRIMRVKRKVPLNEAKTKWPVDVDDNPIVDDADYDAGWAGEDTDEESPYVRHFPGEPLEHEGESPGDDRMVTIVQVQWYEKQTYYRAVLVDPASGSVQQKELNQEQHERAGVRAEQLGMLYRGVKQTRRVYYKAHVGGVVLELIKMEGPSGEAATSFSLHCITAKYDRSTGWFYGLVRAMRGPQTFANKWLSTSVEMLARGAKGGLMLEQGVVDDEDEFEKQWSKPGTNAYFKDGALAAGRVQPKPETVFPQNMMGMTQFAIASIRDVTGINIETIGGPGSTPSGGADTASQEYQRRQGATIILAPLFDSLRRYRRTQGKLLLWLIIEFLSDGRLVRINGKDGEQFVPLVKQPGTMKYDVIVDDAPSSPSQKELVWSTLTTMMPLIQAINPPPSVMMALLEYSPFPASVLAKVKAAIAEEQQKSQQNPQPSPMDLIMMEKQQAIEEEKQKSQIRLDSKKQEMFLDQQHKTALAKIDLQTAVALARVKAKEASIATMPQQGGNPIDVAVQEGMVQGMKAGATRVFTEAIAGQMASKLGIPVGPPSHVSNEGGTAARPGGGGKAAAPAPAPAQ